MRREGESHGLHGVLVLDVVLRGVEQRRRERGVRRGIRGAPHRAGQHARGHRVAEPAYEHLRGRSEQPVDTKSPARGIARSQLREHIARVDRRVSRHDDVAREHHLVEPASIDAPHRLGHGCLPRRHRQRPFGVGDTSRRRRQRHRVRQRCESLLDRLARRARRPGDHGQPRHASTAPHDDPRHHDHRIAGRPVEGEGRERDRPAPRQRDVVIHVGIGEPRGPPALGPGEALHPAELRARRLAPADQPGLDAAVGGDPRRGREAARQQAQQRPVGQLGGQHDRADRRRR